MKTKDRAPVHRVELTDEKRKFIDGLIQLYGVDSAQGAQEALKDLLGGTIQRMLEEEMTHHLGYERFERSDNGNARNGYKPKKVSSSVGQLEIRVPQDRESTFEPQVVKKRQKDISEIEHKVILMYAKGMSTRQISETIREIYGFDVSESLVSQITDRILPDIQDWQSRPLPECFPVIFIDAVYFSVREDGAVRKMAAYVILGIDHEGKKDVLSIEVGENESSRYWLGVLNGLKNRGVKDILVLCADGLTGIGEAIRAAFPRTEYQRCIVHQVRSTLKYVSHRDRKAFANDLRTIYLAPTEEAGLANREKVIEKWKEIYPKAMNGWVRNWDSLQPVYKFSPEIRKIVYTTNAIESLNSGFRRLNNQRSVFPSKVSLLKALYLAMKEITKKWTVSVRNWARLRAEFDVLYEGRLPE